MTIKNRTPRISDRGVMGPVQENPKPVGRGPLVADARTPTRTQDGFDRRPVPTQVGEKSDGMSVAEVEGVRGPAAVVDLHRSGDVARRAAAHAAILYQRALRRGAAPEVAFAEAFKRARAAQQDHVADLLRLESQAGPFGTEAAAAANPLALGHADPHGTAARQQDFLRALSPDALVDTLLMHPSGAMVLEPDAKPSFATLIGLSAAATSPYASNMTGNLEHMREVVAGALLHLHAELQRPLNQAEVDQVVAETMLTDMFAKVEDPSSIRGMPIVPTEVRGVLARTAGELLDQLPEGTRARSLFGTLVHGLVAPSIFRQALALVPTVTYGSDIGAATLAHHWSRFPTQLAVDAGLTVRYDLVPAEHLTKEDATALDTWAKTAQRVLPGLNGLSTQPSLVDIAAWLSDPQHDSHALSKALAALSSHARAQVIGDETQFRPLAMDKWFKIVASRSSTPTMVDVLPGLAATITGYAIESVAFQAERNPQGEVTESSAREALQRFWRINGEAANRAGIFVDDSTGRISALALDGEGHASVFGRPLDIHDGQVLTFLRGQPRDVAARNLDEAVRAYLATNAAASSAT